MVQETDRLEIIKVTNGFGQFRQMGKGAEYVYIKLSEIVSMHAYDESTMLTLSNSSVVNVQEFVVDIMEAMEGAK